MPFAERHPVARRHGGQTVGIDVHNGGYLNGKLIGSEAVPDTAFTDLWYRLADHYMLVPETRLRSMPPQ